MNRALIAQLLAAVAGGVGIAAGLAWLLPSGLEEPATFKILGRAVELGSPGWLLVLGAAPTLLVVRLASLADFSGAQLLLQTVVRFLVLALLAIALARPAVRRDATDVSVVALADVSDSIVDADLDETRRLLAAVESAAGPRRFRLVRFGQRPEEVVSARGPASASLGRMPPPAGIGTDIALALGLGQGLLEPGTVPHVLLLSDGLPTSGDLLAEVERAAARGVRLYFRHLGQGGASGDVAIDSLRAPDEVRPHAPFDLEIRVLASRAGAARLGLEQDGRPHENEAERSVALRPGQNVILWKSRIDQPGKTVYRARILSADHDRRVENNHGTLAVSTEGRPRVLYLEGEPAAAGPFARALEAEKIDVEVRGPRAIPPRQELDRFDLVVLSDVARSEVTDRQMQAIEGFVRDGGGLLMAGGPGSFGSGGYAGTRLEPILPVRLDVPGRREEASLALALVIDKSGSMSGPRMDLTKEAARATAEMMASEDQIAIIVFDSQSTPLVRLQRAANRGRILSDIARIQASGGTNIFPALREAFDELAPARAKKKHVIVLSDGQSQYDGIPELVDDMVAARITVSAVGVGDGADQTLLQTIAARGGGRFYHTRDPASIPRIFTRETAELSRSSVVEQPTGVRVAKKAEMLAGIPMDSAPLLRGYVVTRPRPHADLILTTSKGEPLFARWQVGLGQVAAWTSDIKARWAADWVRWASFGKFWAQAARSTMRRRAANHFPLRASLAGDDATVMVDAVGADDRFLSGLEGKLEVTDTSEPPRTRTLPLVESAPGRYGATFAAGPPGALLLTATLSRAGVLVADAGGRLSVPFAPELRPPLPAGDGQADGAVGGRRLLELAAARTGGREAVSAADVLEAGKDRIQAVTPARTAVLLVALALFVIDVLLRRVRLTSATWKA